MPTESNNPKETYKYWLKEEPPKELKLINGKYYQSPHFTLEYEVFLEMKVTKQWWNEFSNSNNLKINTITSDYIPEKPSWFKVNSSYTVYSRNENDDFNRSRYYIDLSNGKCFVYETYGM